MSGSAFASVSSAVLAVDVRRLERLGGASPGRPARRPGPRPRPGVAVLEPDVALLGGRAVALVEPVEGALLGGLVDDHHRVEVVAAGVVVPEPPGRPAAAAAGLVDRGVVVHAEAGVRRGHRDGLPVDGDLEGLPVGEALLQRLDGVVVRLAADRDAGDLGAARHLLTGEGVRRDVAQHRRARRGRARSGRRPGHHCSRSRSRAAAWSSVGLRLGRHGGHPRFRGRMIPILRRASAAWLSRIPERLSRIRRNGGGPAR